MPVHKVKGGWKWGKTGKTYPTKAQADKQARAIYASGWRENESVTNDLYNAIQENIKEIQELYILHKI